MRDRTGFASDTGHATVALAWRGGLRTLTKQQIPFRLERMHKLDLRVTAP